MAKQQENSRNALKSAVWYTVSSFFIRSIGFITTPIFTRLLTKNDYGQFSNYISWQSILTILVTLNLEATLISARYDFEKTLDKYIFSMICLSSLSVLTWAIGFNLFFDVIGVRLGMKRDFLNIMLLYLLCSSSVTMLQTRERFLFRYKYNVLLSIFISISTIVISIVLVIEMEDKLLGRIIGSVFPTVIIGIIIFLLFSLKVRQVDISYWKYALRICIPYIPHSLSLMLLNSMDRIMINQIRGGEENALYSLAYSYALIITMLFSSLNNAYAPWLGENLSKNNTDKIKGFSKKYIGGFYLIATVFILIAPELIYILGGTEYQEAIYVIPPVGMGLVAQFTYSLFVNIEQYKKKTMGMAITSVLAAFLNYILNSLLIQQYGYIAAAYTTMICYLFILFVHMWIVKRIGYAQVYDYKLTIYYICAMGIISIISNILYSHPIVRWEAIIIWIICFGIFMKRNLSTFISLMRK